MPWTHDSNRGTSQEDSMSSVWMKPITSPKAWRGDALSRDPSSWIVTLSAAELSDIDRALATAKATGRAMLDVEREHFPLTVTRPTLERIGAELYEGRGFVGVRGLPANGGRTADSGCTFWARAPHPAAPLYQNPKGALLAHIYDPGRTYGNIAGRGYETNASLPYHTDAGDVVGLLCLRRSLS